MKLNERDWLVGGHKIGTVPFFTDVEDEFFADKPGTRVLPAPYYYDKKVRFELIKRYEPGEYKHLPKGGYELRGEGGGKHYYDLDQVVVHPSVIKDAKMLEKAIKKAEREQLKRERKYKKAIEKAAGKRGRKPLTPEEKDRRDQEKAARAQVSGGKRGRPKGTGTATKPYVPTGGKRGRRPLDPSIKEARAREAAARTIKSGGKRGRPKRA